MTNNYIDNDYLEAVRKATNSGYFVKVVGIDFEWQSMPQNTDEVFIIYIDENKIVKYCEIVKKNS